ncbi:MAG: GNAT family N-acetyltransferase [Candidatus Hermodarchaeota archaeon]
MEKEVRIQKATLNDAKVLAELSKEAFHTDKEIGGFEEPGGPPGYDSSKFQIWAMRNLTYYKILYDEEIVGGIILNSRKGNHYILERIFVDPRYHNMGIATKAMNSLINEYPDVVWTLGTPEWNVRTRHFYEKLGFKQIGWDEGDGELGWIGIWYQRTTDKTSSSVQNIADLHDGMTEVVVEGKIIEVEPSRKVKSKKSGQDLFVANAFLQDPSGEITIVLWNTQISQIKPGERIRIELGYVSSFRNKLQLNTGYGRLIKLL